LVLPKVTMNASPRPATPDDLEQVLKIESQSFPHPWTRSQFQAELERPYSRFYVLTDDETDEFVHGYIVYWLQAEGVSLLTVAIHPDDRGLGLGPKLLRTMVNEAVRDEIPKVMLEVRSSNLAAIKLYEKLGFKETHARPHFYQNGETAIVMELKTSELSGIIQ